MSNSTDRFLLIAGALLAAAAVGLGAYSAHGLEGLLQEAGFESDLAKRLEWFDTGVRYQMSHALGLLLVGVLADSLRRKLRSVGLLFLLGTLLFSGSLYGMTLLPENFRWLGAITPLGGLSFITGWILLAWKCARPAPAAEEH